MRHYKAQDWYKLFLKADRKVMNTLHTHLVCAREAKYKDDMSSNKKVCQKVECFKMIHWLEEAHCLVYLLQKEKAICVFFFPPSIG